VRRLPVYLLLDTSGSMRGEPIEAVNTGVRVMIGALRQDPHALETVHVSIITFDHEANLLVPLTAIDTLQVPEITTPQSGPTHLGAALKRLREQVARDIRLSTPEQKGDWAPLLFVMTDGKPGDTMLYEDQCELVCKMDFAKIIGCVAGPKARKQDLQPLCDIIVSLDTMDGAGFTRFFEWVTRVVSVDNQSMGTASAMLLPPPPPEIQIVC
jgi:uncharacterized protein YegL